MVSMLQRIDIPEPAAQNDNEIVKKASERFGYSSTPIDPFPAANDNLKAAGVRPFSQESVRKYMAHMRRKANRPYWLATTGIALAFLAVWSAIWTLVDRPNISIVAIIPVLAIYIVAAVSHNPYVWRSTMLSAYREQVPTYALQTALDIADATQGNHNNSGMYAEIRIHHLAKAPKPDQILVSADPFLSVQFYSRYTNESREEFLEVWDEPGFLKERVV